MGILTKIQNLLVKLGALLQTPVLLVIRAYWGWEFMLTGWGKLHNLDKVSHFFASLNIPLPRVSAIAAASTETIGGTLLLLGLCSRYAAFALMVVMCVALGTDDHDATVHLFSNPDKFFAADPFLYLYACVIVFCFGPGWVALDSLLFPRKG